MGKCKQCGKCCEVICLGVDQLQLMKSARHGGDGEFAFDNFKMITREEALKINPYLKKWFDRGVAKHYTYICKQYDKENKKCKIYENRTHLCKNYPWYNGVRANESFYTENCGYIIDTEIMKFIFVLKNIIMYKEREKNAGRIKKKI